MRLLYVALVPLAAACASDVTHIVNTVPADAMAACVTAVAEEAAVPQALVTVAAARAEPTGPALTMDVGGEPATCKLNAEGEVTSVTFP